MSLRESVQRHRQSSRRESRLTVERRDRPRTRQGRTVDNRLRRKTRPEWKDVAPLTPTTVVDNLTLLTVPILISFIEDGTGRDGKFGPVKKVRGNRFQFPSRPTESRHPKGRTDPWEGSGRRKILQPLSGAARTTVQKYPQRMHHVVRVHILSLVFTVDKRARS